MTKTSMILINWRFSCSGEGDVKTKDLSITASTLFTITSQNPSCILSHWLLWAILQKCTFFRSTFYAGHSWVLCLFLGCFQVTVVTESLSNCRHWLQHSLSLVHREGLAQGSETASNIANNSYLTEVVSAYPNSRELSSHTHIDNTNTTPTDKEKKQKVISKSCVSCGKWIAIRWLTLNIPQSADIEQ